MTELLDGWASECIKYACIVMFLAFPFFLIFSNTTMRRLRKLSKNTDKIGGVDLFSGSDIIRVYTTITLSKRWMAKDDPHGLHPFRADREFIDDNTNVLERGLARLVFFLMASSAALILLGTIISFFGWVIDLFL